MSFPQLCAWMVENAACRGVNRSPRNSVNDRPSGWRLALRRQRRLLRPAGWIALASVVACWWCCLVGVRRIRDAGSSRETLSSMRERLGAATAASGLRVTDIVIEGRANTPEPMLRAAIGVNKGDPILGFSLEETRAQDRNDPVGRACDGGAPAARHRRRQPAGAAAVRDLAESGKIRSGRSDRTGRCRSGRRPVPPFAADRRPRRTRSPRRCFSTRCRIARRWRKKSRPASGSASAAGILRMTNGTDVMLPEGHEVAALDRLIQLQQDHAVLDRPLAAIDMRLPDRLVFRPRAEAKDRRQRIPPHCHPDQPRPRFPWSRKNPRRSTNGWPTILVACFRPPRPVRRRSNRLGIIVPARSASSISAPPRSPA